MKEDCLEKIDVNADEKLASGLIEYSVLFRFCRERYGGTKTNYEKGFEIELMHQPCCQPTW